MFRATRASATLALAGSVVLTLAAAPVASAKPAEPSPHTTCSTPGFVGSGEEVFFPKTGGCVSTFATGDPFTGDISMAGYQQRCKALEGLFGGHPMVFEHGPRIDVANNKRECVQLLQFFHGGGLGEE